MILGSVAVLDRYYKTGTGTIKLFIWFYIWDEFSISFMQQQKKGTLVPVLYLASRSTTVSLVRPECHSYTGSQESPIQISKIVWWFPESQLRKITYLDTSMDASRTTGPRSDLRPDSWSWANSGLNTTSRIFKNEIYFNTQEFYFCLTKAGVRSVGWRDEKLAKWKQKAESPEWRRRMGAQRCMA